MDRDLSPGPGDRLAGAVRAGTLGHRLDLEVSAFRMEPASRRQIAVLFKDISARSKAEQERKALTVQLDALIRSSSEVRYRLNADWSELAQLLGGGFIPDSAAGNRNWLQEYIPPEHQKAVKDEFQRAIKDRDTYRLEHKVNLVDGGRAPPSSKRQRRRVHDPSRIVRSRHFEDALIPIWNRVARHVGQARQHRKSCFVRPVQVGMVTRGAVGPIVGFEEVARHGNRRDHRCFAG